MAEVIAYRDGDIVWVKMNKLWWPGEVHAAHRLPSDFFDQFKKPPLYVVKFFQENNYHYVNQLNQIARFNCAKKSEFIKKGLDLFYAKHQYMGEFPADVAIAEKRTGGDPNIIYSKEFLPAKKPDKTARGTPSKGLSSRSRRGQQKEATTAAIPRVMIKPDHDARILVPTSSSMPSSPTVTPTDAKYKCTSCNFTTNRINTVVWHQKTHNSPNTPQSSSTNKFERTRSLNVDLTKSNSSTNIGATDENTDKEDKTTTESVPVAIPEKTSGKRQRETSESRAIPTEKEPKTENKLKNILDDWSDDDMAEAGPSGLTSNNRNSSIILNTNDEDEDDNSSVNKKLKFNNENETTDNTQNEVEIKEKPIESNDLSEKVENTILNENIETIVEEETGVGPRLGRRSMRDNSTSRQSGRLQSKNVVNDEVPTPLRSHLRSGKAKLNEKTILPTPKRRGRSAKQNDKNELINEIVSEKIKKTENEPLLFNKIETINEVKSSPEEKLTDQLVVSPALDEEKKIDKSNSKKSRKGKPGRKVEIKLANNVSVAVLVEKTTPSSVIDKVELKVDLPIDESEYTNVVHKKIRYMSHSSTDDHRKSIDTSKLPEPVDNPTENEVIVDTDDSVHFTNQTSDTNNENNEEKNFEQNSNDIPQIDLVLGPNDENVTDEIVEEFIVHETVEEHRSTPKCYKRKTIPDIQTSSPVPFIDDANNELPSTSYSRQRSPK